MKQTIQVFRSQHRFHGTCHQRSAVTAKGRVFYLAKMDLVKDDLVRVSNAPKSCHEGKGSDNYTSQLVVPLGLHHLGHLVQGSLSGAIGFRIAILGWRGRWSFLFTSATMADTVSRH